MMKAVSLPRRRSTGFSSAMLGICLVLTLSGVPSAHVLDQYLQASRIELREDRINLEIDLTPGIEIASPIFLHINTNRDGEISSAEGRAYATQVLQDLVLTEDDQRLTFKLLDCRYPSYDEMRAGTGTIHLRAEARAHIDRPGRHRIFYRNQHQIDRSIYVVNALVPAARFVTITRQDRDRQQSEIRLDYAVTPRDMPAGAAGSWHLSGIVGGILLLIAGCGIAHRAGRS